jgi:hypothetical protein
MGKTRRNWLDIPRAERDDLIMAEMARSAEDRESKEAEFKRKCTTNPVSRRVVENLLASSRLSAAFPILFKKAVAGIAENRPRRLGGAKADQRSPLQTYFAPGGQE